MASSPASARFKRAVARRDAAARAHSLAVLALVHKWLDAIANGTMERWPMILSRLWRDTDGVDWATCAELDLDADVAAWRVAGEQDAENAASAIAHFAALRRVVGAYYTAASRVELAPTVIAFRRDDADPPDTQAVVRLLTQALPTESSPTVETFSAIKAIRELQGSHEIVTATADWAQVFVEVMIRTTRAMQRDARGVTRLPPPLYSREIERGHAFYARYGEWPKADLQAEPCFPPDIVAALETLATQRDRAAWPTRRELDRFLRDCKLTPAESAAIVRRWRVLGASMAR